MADQSCKSFREGVYAYIANELDASNRQAMSTHLEGCSSCTALYNVETKISDILSFSSDQLSTNFSMKIQSRLRSESE